ncbi:hypothetical protein AVDCRST_MAG82-1666 [uncultured Rubrobacteraceae bacterium]|uniref:Uncharacterized protein n=1 Tax=uncultured Rubrobacteraceae bacterium TaxID=349277 RepID=A0A6J4PUL3_9ACTN|nr:hypothetical protein AVDCRST_MAG82-1666 [uncultured Rubrobacteraceae bacterium]
MAFGLAFGFLVPVPLCGGRGTAAGGGSSPAHGDAPRRLADKARSAVLTSEGKARAC